MRQSLFLGVLAALAWAHAAQADEFCDSPRDISGSECRQILASVGDTERATVLPNFKSLDLRSCAAIECDSLHFALDLKKLDLDAATPNDPEKATRVDVLELGVLSPALAAAGQNGYRLLGMSILHVQGDDAYTVEFSWREQQGPWLPIVSGSVPVELNAAVAALSSTETYLTFKIVPVDDDWSDLAVRVSAYNNATGENRDVPLAFLDGDGFSIPGAAGNEGSATQPWLLRSGVIDGDLKRTGMTTDFAYRNRWVRTIEASSLELPPEQPQLPPPDSFD
ncbi:MAG TPA: hypothetical protein VM555_04505 [Tahibacter sp.]|nr:hypothetical protein [Tahibacter sp.]